MKELAMKKLESERNALKKGKPDKYVSAMMDAVHDALADFCRQDGEFAQAVAQGGSFADCMKAVAGGVKNNAISDLDAYRLAVQFYFPGADIRCQMAVNLCAGVAQDAAGQQEKQEKQVVLDLFDLL